MTGLRQTRPCSLTQEHDRSAIGSGPQRITSSSRSRDMLQIEPYQAADLPIIQAFIGALHDAERELMPILSPGAELASSGVSQMLHDISDDKGLALLAKWDGTAIGFGCVLFDDYRDPSYCEAERCRAYLSYLYVR